MPRCARERCERWRPALFVRHGRAGLYLDDCWYCSTACVEAVTLERLVAAGQPDRRVSIGNRGFRLGPLLQHQCRLSAADLRRALACQSETGQRLGRVLVQLGLISEDDLLQALATQAGIPYLRTVDPACVLAGPGNLTVEAVRALGLVPVSIDAEARSMNVACAAPVPRVALRALERLTGLSVHPYLVADDQLAALLANYASARQPPAADRPGGVVRDVDGAAAHVAQVAAETRRVRLTHERCDPYVWVRLEGTGEPEDVLVPLPETSKEVPWRVARTLL